MPVIRKESDQPRDLNRVSASRVSQIEEASGVEPRERDAPGKKYSDVIMARLSPGRRNVFKAFFSEHGLTMNSGVEMCVEYVMEQVRSGNLRISKAGIR